MNNFTNFSSEYYFNLRNKAESVADSNLQAANNISGFSNAQKRLNELLLQKAKLDYANDGSNIIISKKIQLAKESLCNLLEKNGLSFDMLSPVYACSLCNDTGLDKDFKNCICKRKLYASFLLLKYNVNYNELPSFESAVKNIQNKLFIDSLVKFSQNFIKNKNLNFFLAGAPGVGKTYLAKCTVKSLVDSGYSTIFTTSFNLINKLNELRFTSSAQLNAELSRLYNCDFLIIDDLGCEPQIANFTLDYLLNIINERITNKKGSMFTSNLSLEQLKTLYNDRIFDRITDPKNCKLLKIDGENMRKQI